jgi:hypothetical protein
MKDTFIVARLVQEDLIRLVIFSAFLMKSSIPPHHRSAEGREKSSRAASPRIPAIMIVDYHLKEACRFRPFLLLSIAFGLIPVDVSEATTFPSFDEKYIMTATISARTAPTKSCEFVVWAPLASSVILKVHKAERETLALSDYGAEDKRHLPPRSFGRLSWRLLSLSRHQ